MDWQPIETAPKESVDPWTDWGPDILLGFAPDDVGETRPTREGRWRPAYFDKDQRAKTHEAGWVTSIDPDVYSPYIQPTHWMPLPLPPEGL